MSRKYDKPEVKKYGSVESHTKSVDKIGSADDGIDYVTDEGQTLDGEFTDDQ